MLQAEQPSAGKTRVQMREGSLVRDLDVLLKPLSRPELGEIRIDSNTFAVGRKQPPFATYAKDILARLSRRHARIFVEEGAVYVVDLESRNGTTVNGATLADVPRKLSDGDEICFGGTLSYRVAITPRSRPATSSLFVTLRPKPSDCGLDTIVIVKFPFLISKADANFSRYTGQSEHGRQLRYLSRRHAQIYEQDGQAYIQDLGSGNGTFVDGERLAEQPVPLNEGAVLALGGQHFVYEVIIQRVGDELSDSGPRKFLVKREPSVREESIGEKADGEAQQAQAQRPPKLPVQDKTQFVASPTSFLQIYGGDKDAQESSAASPSAVVPAARASVIRQGPLRRVRSLLSEIAVLGAEGEPAGVRSWWRAAAVGGILAVLALTAYFWSSPERDLKNAVARGQYARAAGLASRLLEKHPDDAELRARTTEMALKANVPDWLASIEARDFDGARNVLTHTSELGAHDADLRSLVGELGWLGELERLVSRRGGPQAPIRIYADEASIADLLERWNEDTEEHQRAMVRVASYVPQFNDWYEEALSHLRRLQSGAVTYLPVIERLKSNIATELARDNPRALQPELQEIADKYPGLGGLDDVRRDLARYIDIRRYADGREPGRLFALLHSAHFVTPPFAQSFRTLIESGQLPTSDLLQQYDAATQIWIDGRIEDSFVALQKMTPGRWSQYVDAELQRRRSVSARFVALQQSRTAGDFVDQLLAFRGSLDPEADVYFLRATASDLNRQRDAVLARAQDAMSRARTAWQAYQGSGGIDAFLQIETSISDKFRLRARLLAEASQEAQRASLIYSAVDPGAGAGWSALRDEIESEARLQRDKLRDLSNVLEPELLNAKLALLGEPGE
jgi:pSer/pThr/pTyr-binding forkhead associated (FHA) protein